MNIAANRPNTTPSAPLLVHLVRHGQAYNTHPPEDVTYPPNPPLTSVGEAQAELLARRLSNLDVGRLVSSPMRRSVETANAVSRVVAKPVEVWARCYEHRQQPGYWCWGARELRERYPDLIIPEDLDPAGWYYGEEQIERAIERADEFLGWLWTLARQDGRPRPLVVVSHGAFIRIVLSRVLQTEPSLVAPVVFDNTSLTTLRLSVAPEERTHILAVNDTTHLSGYPELDPLHGVSR